MKKGEMGKLTTVEKIAFVLFGIILVAMLRFCGACDTCGEEDRRVRQVPQPMGKSAKVEKQRKEAAQAAKDEEAEKQGKKVKKPKKKVARKRRAARSRIRRTSGFSRKEIRNYIETFLIYQAITCSSNISEARRRYIAKYGSNVLAEEMFKAAKQFCNAVTSPKAVTYFVKSILNNERVWQKHRRKPRWKQLEVYLLLFTKGQEAVCYELRQEGMSACLGGCQGGGGVAAAFCETTCKVADGILKDICGQITSQKFIQTFIAGLKKEEKKRRR